MADASSVCEPPEVADFVEIRAPSPMDRPEKEKGDGYGKLDQVDRGWAMEDQTKLELFAIGNDRSDPESFWRRAYDRQYLQSICQTNVIHLPIAITGNGVTSVEISEALRRSQVSSYQADSKDPTTTM